MILEYFEIIHEKYLITWNWDAIQRIINIIFTCNRKIHTVKKYSYMDANKIY